jgi:hypothetical protein
VSVGPAPFRNNKALARVRLMPHRRIPGPSPTAATWNRIGGLLMRLSALSGITSATALAVWKVECGALDFIRGRPVLRFEPHIFFSRWGKDHEALFDVHFQFGGRHGIDGARWQNHMFRNRPSDDWRRFHGDQAAEYQALALAAKLAGRETASQCASFGGPQIMGFNHDAVGYATADEMRRAFSRSERWQVCGFFDFCAAKGIVGSLMAQDWQGFATVYNGPGNAETYAARIAAAHAEARQLLESQ